MAGTPTAALPCDIPPTDMRLDTEPAVVLGGGATTRGSYTDATPTDIAWPAGLEVRHRRRLFLAGSRVGVGCVCVVGVLLPGVPLPPAPLPLPLPPPPPPPPAPLPPPPLPVLPGLVGAPRRLRVPSMPSPGKLVGRVGCRGVGGDTPMRGEGLARSARIHRNMVWFSV